MVGVERAVCCAASTSTWLLSADTLTLSLDQAAVNTFGVHHEREGICPREEERGDSNRLHLVRIGMLFEKVDGC